MTRRTGVPRLVAVGAAAAVVVAACTSSPPTGDPATSTAAASTAQPSAAATVVPTGPVVPSSTFGMHVQGVQGGLWPTTSIGALRLWDNETAWSQVEKKKGQYDWAAIDGAVATAQVNGLSDIMLVLGSTPEWAATDVREGDRPLPGAASPPKSLADWDRWVRAVATRYAGKVTAYQIWNEANLSTFWTGGPQLMAEMTARAAKIIRKVDPDAAVVAASSSTRLSAAYEAFFPEYLAGLKKRDWPIDVLAVHLYPPGPGTPGDRVVDAETVLAAVRKAGAPDDVEVWDTEVNYGIAGPGAENPGVQITGPQAAGWVARTYLDGLRVGMARVYWFLWTQAPIDFLGLQMLPGSEGAAGLATVTDWVRGANWEGCEESGTAVVCGIVRDGVPAAIAWTDEGESTVPAPAGASQRCDVAGQCAATAEGLPVPVTTSPVIIR